MQFPTTNSGDASIAFNRERRTFALLPPDNATGNFTKIVQRVPVKIVFEPDSIRGYESRVYPGLSCQPKIDLRTGPQ